MASKPSIEGNHTKNKNEKKKKKKKKKTTDLGVGSSLRLVDGELVVGQHHIALPPHFEAPPQLLQRAQLGREREVVPFIHLVD